MDNSKIDVARQLFEVQGVQQKEIAKTLGVSEKTIGTWIVKYQWVKNDEMVKKRKEAEKLFLVQGLNQKEAAKIVGVSEKTVGNWANKYKWRAGKNRLEEPGITRVDFATGLREHVMISAPRHAGKLCLLIDEYLRSLDN